MKNLFSKKAEFEDVVKDKDAVDFHAEKFLAGFRYPLAWACYHHRESLEKDASNSRN